MASSGNRFSRDSLDWDLNEYLSIRIFWSLLMRCTFCAEMSAPSSSDNVTTTRVRVGGELEKPLAGRSLEEETVSLD